jgi:hypothetical protein
MYPEFTCFNGKFQENLQVQNKNMYHVKLCSIFCSFIYFFSIFVCDIIQFLQLPYQYYGGWLRPCENIFYFVPSIYYNILFPQERYFVPTTYYLVPSIHYFVLHFCSVIGGCFLLLTFLVCLHFFAVALKYA